MVLLDLGPCSSSCPSSFTRKLFYCTSRVLYRCLLGYVSLKLPNIVCEEIVRKRRSLFTKGTGSQRLNQDLFGTRGFSSLGGNLAICTDF